jgi:hypothetical protein
MMKYLVTGGKEKDLHYTIIIENQDADKKEAPADPPPAQYKEQKKEKK